ncbi:hypothetical protein HY251_17670 [bacterium]|nr:hypothetical protein [bacterium]
MSPAVEDGEPGQLDVFVDKELVVSLGGLLKALFGPGKDAVVDQIARRLASPSPSPEGGAPGRGAMARPQ